jgi:signal transduction histidine kinase
MNRPDHGSAPATAKGVSTPAPDRGAVAESAARPAGNGQDLESLTRPLLEALSKLGRFESAYLMVFDWTRGQQEVRFTYNAGGVDVPEGMRVAIAPGLSPQALPGVTRSLETLPEAHPDSQVARDLALQTYVSVPVVVAEHRLWGMLCVASRAPRQVGEGVISVMEYLARLIADHVVREQTAATERRAEAAEESLRARALFLAETEHELKTPLTVIVGMARTLTNDWPNLTENERREFLSAVTWNADILSQRIDNLLVEAQAELRARSLGREEVPVSQVLRATARGFDGAFPDHRVMAGDGEEITALADPSALQQVLGLLLDNAVKYSPGGGTILLTARRTRQQVVIEVVDDGMGVPEDIDIYAPFQRGPEAAGGTPGIGLGLHIVRNLVEAMGGSIHGRRNRDRGSTFSITLPAR